MAAEPETTILTIRPPNEAFIAASDKTVIITAMETSQILGLRQIEGLDKTFLYSARLMMPSVTEQLLRTDAAVRDYSAMEQRRFETQLTFALIYIILTLVILLSAIWLGLSLADRLVSPIGRLILMTRRLGEGDLKRGWKPTVCVVTTKSNIWQRLLTKWPSAWENSRRI